MIKVASAPPAVPVPAPSPKPTPTPAPAPAPPPKADMAALQAKGEEIFQKTAGGVGCQYCHGKDAKGGNLGPDIRGKTGEEIIGALGRDPMTFLFLTDEEIEAVAIYLKYLQSQP